MNVYGCHEPNIFGTLVYPTEIKYVLLKLKFSIFNFRAFDHWHGMEKWCYKSTQQCCHVLQFDINGYIGIYCLISIKNGHPINPHCIMSIWTDYFLTPVCVCEVFHMAKISQKRWLNNGQKWAPKWCLCVIPEVLNKKHSSHHICKVPEGESSIALYICRSCGL